MDNTQRFSNRGVDYVKYRPSYPAAMVEYLVSRLEAPNPVVVDVGSGTGILTRLLAPHFSRVVGVEPNQARAKREFQRILRPRGLVAESFTRNAHAGTISFRYNTMVYLGELRDVV